MSDDEMSVSSGGAGGASDEEEVPFTLDMPDVVTKYQTAGTIANQVLKQIIASVKPDVRVVDLCELGDRMIEKETSALYKNVEEKGIAFPTCISQNNCAGHFSPLAGDVTLLKAGDVVKIDLGVHIDGAIALVAHTMVVGAEPVTGRKADVIAAAHAASEAALRLLRPGHKNAEITDAIDKCAKAYKCEPCEGVLSHNMKRFIIDGTRVIINKQTVEHKVDDVTFEPLEVYHIDVAMSTGDGKTRELGDRTTVFKRTVDNYSLKMKASRFVLSEINKRFPTMPFTIRALDEKRGRLGIVELVKHGLVEPYPVLYDREDQFVAQFKFTALIMPSQTLRITGAEAPAVQSEHSLEKECPEMHALLQTSVKKSRKKKKSAAKKAAAGGAAGAAAAGGKEEEDDEEMDQS